MSSTAWFVMFLMLAGAALASSEALPESVLIDADRAFNRQTEEEGVDGWLAWFAPNAAVFPTQGPVVRGIKGVTAYYAGLEDFPPAGFGWQPERGGMAASGDLGWTVGDWAIEGAEGVGGRYLSIWGLQADGSWKVVADCGGQPDFRAISGLIGGVIATPEQRAADLATFTSADGDMVVRGGVWKSETDGTKSGKALVVFVRQDDGAWEVVTEIGFSVPPQAPVEQ